MKNIILTMVLTAVLGVYAVTAQTAGLHLKKSHIENLIKGINSDNTGLKKSAIYMAGKYGITETSDVLIEQLRKETDPSTKILIALALYKIGSEEGMEEVGKLVRTDSNNEVKRMSKAIINQWHEEKDLVVLK